MLVASVAHQRAHGEAEGHRLPIHHSAHRAGHDRVPLPKRRGQHAAQLQLQLTIDHVEELHARLPPAELQVSSHVLRQMHHLVRLVHDQAGRCVRLQKALVKRRKGARLPLRCPWEHRWALRAGTTNLVRWRTDPRDRPPAVDPVLRVRGLEQVLRDPDRLRAAQKQVAILLQGVVEYLENTTLGRPFQIDQDVPAHDEIDP